MGRIPSHQGGVDAGQSQLPPLEKEIPAQEIPASATDVTPAQRQVSRTKLMQFKYSASIYVQTFRIAYSIVNISDPFDPAAAAAPQHQQKQRSVERRIRSNESTDDAGIQTITTISHIKTVERRRPATANPVARVSSDNYRFAQINLFSFFH